MSKNNKRKQQIEKIIREELAAYAKAKLRGRKILAERKKTAGFHQGDLPGMGTRGGSVSLPEPEPDRAIPANKRRSDTTSIVDEPDSKPYFVEAQHSDAHEEEEIDDLGEPLQSFRGQRRPENVVAPLNEQGPTPRQRLQNAYRGADYRLGGYLPQGVTPGTVQANRNSPVTQPMPAPQMPGGQMSGWRGSQTAPPIDWEMSRGTVPFNPAWGDDFNNYMRTSAGLAPLRSAPAMYGPTAQVAANAPSRMAAGPRTARGQMDNPRDWSDTGWERYRDSWSGVGQFDPSSVYNWSADSSYYNNPYSGPMRGLSGLPDAVGEYAGPSGIPGDHIYRHAYDPAMGPLSAAEQSRTFPGVDPTTLRPDYESNISDLQTGLSGEIAPGNPDPMASWINNPGQLMGPERPLIDIPITQAQGRMDRGMRIGDEQGTYNTGANAEAWVNYLETNILPGTSWEGRGTEYFENYIWPQHMEATNLRDISGYQRGELDAGTAEFGRTGPGAEIRQTDPSAPGAVPMVIEPNPWDSPETIKNRTRHGHQLSPAHIDVGGNQLVQVRPDQIAAAGFDMSDVMQHEMYHSRQLGAQSIDPFVGLLGTDAEGRYYEDAATRGRLQTMRDRGAFMRDSDGDGIRDTEHFSVLDFQRPHLERTGFTMAPPADPTAAGAQHTGYFSDLVGPAGATGARPGHDDEGYERLAGYTQWRDQDMQRGGTGRMTRDNLEWIDTAGSSGTNPFSRSGTAGLGGMVHGVHYDQHGRPTGGETYNAIRGMLGHGTEPGASTWGQQQSGETQDQRFDRVLTQGLDQIIGRAPGQAPDWREEAEDSDIDTSGWSGDENRWNPEESSEISAFSENKKKDWRNRWRQFLTEEASEQDWKDYGVNTTSPLPAGGDETGKIEHVPDVGTPAAAISADAPVEGDDNTELTEQQMAFFRSNGLI